MKAKALTHNMFEATGQENTSEALGYFLLFNALLLVLCCAVLLLLLLLLHYYSRAQ